KGLVCRVFLGIHRCRSIQRQRRDVWSLRLVALLRRRLALACLVIEQNCRCGSARARQQSRGGYRLQPNTPFHSHPFSPRSLFLLRFRARAAPVPQSTPPGKNRTSFKVALWFCLRQPQSDLFALIVLPSPYRTPTLTLTNTLFFILM